jgi:hypothetical protein
MDDDGRLGTIVSGWFTMIRKRYRLWDNSLKIIIKNHELS